MFSNTWYFAFITGTVNCKNIRIKQSTSCGCSVFCVLQKESCLRPLGQSSSHSLSAGGRFKMLNPQTDPLILTGCSIDLTFTVDVSDCWHHSAARRGWGPVGGIWTWCHVVYLDPVNLEQRSLIGGLLSRHQSMTHWLSGPINSQTNCMCCKSAHLIPLS